jgi:exodeoxyribonuclease VII large subunit
VPAITPATLPDPALVLSVGELTQRIKSLLEGAVPEVWVRGEISNFRRQPSGHLYFTLKDSSSQLPCVLFRADALRSSLEWRDGLQLLVFGQLSVYEPRGAYQLIVRWVLEDGVGRLRQEFERLKARLAAEGLFATERKRPLPARPRTIGFITSPGGAAVRDFISILRRRGWRGRLVLLPAKVQGREAAPEMLAQLRAAAALRLFDLLVIGRGGGSLEDLWAFNDEALVRAVAACPVPVISAVGHETDFTLCDFAADRRAETPSAAAELISSARLEQAERVAAAAAALRNIAAFARERRGGRLALLRYRWQSASPQNFIEQAQLRLDEFWSRTRLRFGDELHSRRDALSRARSALLAHAPSARLTLEHARTDGLCRRLEAAGVDRILARGFVILADTSGKALTRRVQLTPGQRVRARFADGEAGLTAETRSSPPSKSS